MMKFVKIRVPSNNHEAWLLLIHDKYELDQYLEMDNKAYTRALFSMRKDPDEHGNNVSLDHLFTHRERILAVTIEHAINITPVNGKVWPNEVVASIITEKNRVMSKALDELGVLQINDVGGWCDHESFMRIHKCEIIDTIDMDGPTFPQDKPPITADVLVLENGPHILNDFRAILKVLFPNKSYFNSICNLKEKDARWVAKSIELSPTIAMQTNAQDSIQIESMMRLFTKMPHKSIFINTTNKEAICNHKLFELNNTLHTIKFI